MTAPAKRIMSLKQPTLKMSKSHEDPRSRILISDNAEDIRAKIRLALTDSTLGISYDPLHRPGVSNLLSILSYLDRERRSCEELAVLYQDLTMRQFKDVVTESIESCVSEIRDTYCVLMRRSGDDALDSIAQKGGLIANREANATMADVRKAIGLT